MNLLVTGFFYLYVFLLAFFDVGAFYYTYRITKVVGVFRGWILMLVFVVIFATEGVVAFGASAALTILSPSRLDTYLNGSGTVSSLLGTGLYNLILAALLFGAMFELYRTFNRVSSKASSSETEENELSAKPTSTT
ncbi:MAG: hypothetical protein OK442_06570 [Thaumarchaeota archaeon]|nr:hypothetical protein [Nitrososphaerota archaeon]